MAAPHCYGALARLKVPEKVNMHSEAAPPLSIGLLKESG